MNFFERFIYWLQATMETPQPFGWFHILCIILTILFIYILYKLKNKYNEKQLKLVLFIYGFIALLLETLKQISWSFNYESSIITWDYQWYSFPFQLCSTPIYVSLICVFLKNNKIRKKLLSYLAFVTILGGFMTILIPTSCFTKDILVNIHTMWLHCGSFVLSVYLIMTKEVELNKRNLFNAFIIFIVFILLAQILNISIYNSGILNGETFNMFYISPYFISVLPVFDVIQQNLPYIAFLLIYIVAILLGSAFVYLISYLIMKKLKNK